MIRALVFTLALFGSTTLFAKQPSILWITAEDMSPTLGCYGDAYADSPHIDALAKKSALYTHAFATAPVCSPVRSCLITGCYPPSLGTHQMRSAFPIADEITGFPSYLRKAGYYTTNNVKTDYNTANYQKIIEASWDESSPTAHWRNRPDKQQPFFAVFNLMTSHQSRTMQWPYEKFQAEVQSRLTSAEIHDPARAPLPPYYPDTPIVRKTVARYYDCVTAMDKEVGEILKQLKDDGLEDDTIVFFYSDHGSGMPRHKRALLDSGMRVPLLIHAPKKYADLIPAKMGTKTDALISFIDFSPSVLNLAGIERPLYMKGLSLLGENVSQPRTLVWGHRDRVDEVIDCARSVRTQRYLYIRNYMPHLGYNQRTAWPDGGEIRHEFYRLTDREKLTPAQWQFVSPTRPVEELYDCKTDPHNLENLAESAEHQKLLKRLRTFTHLQDASYGDQGLCPEIELQNVLNSHAANRKTGAETKLFWFEVATAADKVGMADEPAYLRLLDDKNPSIRYWGAVAMAGLKEPSHKAIVDLLLALKDKSAAVRIAAADALARHGKTDQAVTALIADLAAEDMTTVMYAARAIELMGSDAESAIEPMQKALARAESLRDPDAPATEVQPGDADLAMFVGFSARAFLANFQSDESESQSLFNGKDLTGWSARAKGDVSVKDGEIQILSKGANLWLVHEATFSDFELTLEAKMPDDGYNSGVGFRCTGKGRPKGYQCEIDRAKTGMIYAIGSGWVWPKGAEETKRFNAMAEGAFDNAKWNTLRIRSEGQSIKIWVNDKLTADVTDKRFASGSIALQHHGKGGLHRFRNINIRELK